METSLVFVAGIALCVIALGIAAIGMRSEGFPSPGVLKGMLVGTALVVVLTGAGAVLAARHEQDHRRGETEELLAEAHESDEERESGTVLRELRGEEQAQSLFTARCGVCHQMEAAGTKGEVGPDLDSLAPNAERTLKAIQQGGLDTGRMPERLVEGGRAKLVADYVAAATK